MGIVTASVRVAVIAAVVLAGPAAAAAEPEGSEPASQGDMTSVGDTEVATVTIRPGPIEFAHEAPPCSDVVYVHEASNSVILERAGGAEADVTVALAEAGPAVPGVDHEALPRTVTWCATRPSASTRTPWSSWG